MSILGPFYLIKNQFMKKTIGSIILLIWIVSLALTIDDSSIALIPVWVILPVVGILLTNKNEEHEKG